MKRVLILSLVCIVCCAAISTQAQKPKKIVATTTVKKPVSKIKDISSLIDSLRKKYDMPALAGEILDSKSVLALGVTGVRQFGNTIAVTDSDQFHLGSCTKMMTATLIGMLVEEKKLKWKTTIAEIFPEWKDSILPVYRNVTIDQLLNQHSGFSDATWLQGQTGLQLHDLKGTASEQREYYAKHLLREEPVNKPGTKYLYSNRNYALLGVIEEKLFGKPWETVIQDRIFTPLGMATAGFGAMGEAGKVDQPYQHLVDEKGEHQVIEPGPLSDNPIAIAPAGLVHCSIEDWGKFIRMQLLGDQGKNTLVKASTMKHLHTPPSPSTYMGGWDILKREWAGKSGRALTHSGSNNLNFATVWMAPELDLAVLVTTNQAGGTTAAAVDDVVTNLIRLYFTTFLAAKMTK